MKSCSNKFSGIQPVEPEKIFPFFSEGTYSMHELLEFLLQKTGPATVRVMSFSITEVAIRTFLNLMENGNIKKLECIFDLTVKRHRLGLLYFMNNVVSAISLTKNHAKLILIQNKNWKITVVGSANFNVNDKIEAGVISTQPDFFNFYNERFNLWFNQGILVSKDEFN
jgi:hypothetical protein